MGFDILFSFAYTTRTLRVHGYTMRKQSSSRRRRLGPTSTHRRNVATKAQWRRRGRLQQWRGTRRRWRLGWGRLERGRLGWGRLGREAGWGWGGAARRGGGRTGTPRANSQGNGCGRHDALRAAREQGVAETCVKTKSWLHKFGNRMREPRGRRPWLEVGECIIIDVLQHRHDTPFCRLECAACVLIKILASIHAARFPVPTCSPILFLTCVAAIPGGLALRANLEVLHMAHNLAPVVTATSYTLTRLSSLSDVARPPLTSTSAPSAVTNLRSTDLGGMLCACYQHPPRLDPRRTDVGADK